MKSYVLLLALTLSAVVCQAKEPALTPQQYWVDFRQAVIVEDYSTLRSYTQFPLAIHGAVDGIPVKNVGAEQFEKELKKILDQPMANFEGDDVVTYTMRDLVIKTTALDNSRVKDGKNFRLGELIFEKKGNNWKLIQAYLSE